MRIAGEVTAVREDGDVLVVEVSGKGVAASQWGTRSQSAVKIPNTTQARRAFFVGRPVTITVEPGS